MSIFVRFEIDSTVEFPSDHFAVSFVGSDPFRNKTASDTVDLSIGLLSGTGAPQVISFIENGITDEFEIVILPAAITGTKNGRDGIASALDGFFEKRYYRFPETVPEYPPRDPTTHQPIPQEDSTHTPLPPPPPGVSGIFMASQIAREAAASVGIGLVWGCPDYELVENFFATGRVIDTINNLVQPFTMVSPFRADIYSEGTTLIIRPRNPSRAPDFTITLAAAKRETATLRVRKTQLYGQVWLTGAPEPLNQNSSGIWIEGEETFRTVDEARDANDQILSRVETEETKITPTGQTKRKVVTSYVAQDGGGSVLKLTDRTTTTNEYTIGTFGIAGPIQPKVLKSTQTKKEGYDDAGNFIVTEVYERGFSYDEGIATGKQTTETELTKKLDQSVTPPVLVPDLMKVKATKDNGYLLIEHVTTSYQFTQDNTGHYIPVFDRRDVQRQSGFRAGGPAALPRRTGSDRGDAVRLVRTFSTDKKAVKVVQNFPNINLDGLKLIMAQFEHASGLWEYEVALAGVNMPWIRRGMYLQITDIESEIPGTLIPLPVLLVTEVVTEYDESSLTPRSISKIRAFGWSSV